jgi:hypothetical protein
MNRNPMHEARAALAPHPVRGPLSDYRIPCCTRHRMWLVTFMQYGLGFFDHEAGRVDQRQGGLPGQTPVDPSTGRPTRRPA